MEGGGEIWRGVEKGELEEWLFPFRPVDGQSMVDWGEKKGEGRGRRGELRGVDDVLFIKYINKTNL